MRNVVILGTGQAQADAIKALAERGVRVCACSYVSGDAGERYAQEFKQTDIVDVDAVETYAAQCGADCVYSVGSDIAMPTVAGVSERRGLECFISAETAQLCGVKSAWRKKLGRSFEGNVGFQTLISATDELEVDFPLMVKPVDSQGQRGVCRVDSREELESCFEDALSFSRSGCVIIEEFVKGSEISVNAFSVAGEVVFALMSDRVVWDEFPGGIIHEHILPSRFATDVDVADKVESLVRRTLAALGIENGPSYFQIMITPQGDPKLIEVAPRLDGCHMWRLIWYATGVDLLEMTIDLLLAGTCTPVGPFELKPCRLEFLCLPPGETFMCDAFSVGEPAYLQWYYENGDKVKKMNGYMEKCGYRIVGL